MSLVMVLLLPIFLLIQPERLQQTSEILAFGTLPAEDLMVIGGLQQKLGLSQYRIKVDTFYLV